ncbi:MAG: NAD(P)-binding domain-containing protein [Bacteroidales bacterium]|jgi:glycerol-3-phosphate dehydrogenase (NAD(P)+)|nr:NAD(P)-binding domain-containing protein [Bacteroidales bacterium]
MIKIAHKIGVIGGGSWATAIIKLLQHHQKNANWFIRRQEVIDSILNNGHNPEYLSQVELNIGLLNMSNVLEDVINESDIVIFAIPAAFLHRQLEQLDKNILQDKIVISAVKGIVPEYNFIISKYFNQVFNVPLDNYGALAGPTHAEEVVMDRLSFLTVASKNEDVSGIMADVLGKRNMRISQSQDVEGIEYASVLKNVYAVAAGVSVGLGYGDNFLSVLTTNAIVEMRRFLDAVNHLKRDVIMTSYSGDIVVTCYSQFSRNRMFGTLIGKGYSVNYSRIEMKQVAEGYTASKCMKEINDEFYKIDMPILNAVYNICHNNVSPSTEMRKLAEKLK